MVEIHPRTRQRFTRPLHSGDIIIDAQGTTALSQDVIPVVGGFEDFTGSGGLPTKQQLYAGMTNQLWGTNAALDGAKKENLGVIGQNIETTRLRRKKLYIK